MPSIVTLNLSVALSEAGGADTNPIPSQFVRWSTTVIKRETVSLTGSAFTALSPPTGAKGVIVLVGANPSLTLKGVTGDSGIALTPSSGVVGIPLVSPLGTAPNVGILNGNSAAASVVVLWV